MMPILPPHANAELTKALVEARANPQQRLTVARHTLPWRQRVCMRCGQRLVQWGERLIALAPTPKPQVQQPLRRPSLAE